jgi:hypothetical protein
MASPSSREAGIQELIHRLHVREFQPEHVIEAARLLAQIQTHSDSIAMAQKLMISPLIQVRTFATQLLKAIASESSKARATLSETTSDEVQVEEKTPAQLSYAAIGEVIKQWIHEEKKMRPGKAGF